MTCDAYEEADEQTTNDGLVFGVLRKGRWFGREEEKVNDAPEQEAEEGAAGIIY